MAVQQPMSGVGSPVSQYQSNCVLVVFVVSMVKHEREKHKKKNHSSKESEEVGSKMD